MRFYVLVNAEGEYISSYDLRSGAKYYTDDLPNALAYEDLPTITRLAELLNCTVKAV